MQAVDGLGWQFPQLLKQANIAEGDLGKRAQRLRKFLSKLLRKQRAGIGGTVAEERLLDRVEASLQKVDGSNLLIAEEACALLAQLFKVNIGLHRRPRPVGWFQPLASHHLHRWACMLCIIIARTTSAGFVKTIVTLCCACV